MRRSCKRFLGVPIAVLVAAGLMTGCDSDDTRRTVRIGVIAPLSGPLGAVGLGVRNSVELAVKQANRQRLVKGWKLVLAAEDDTAVPDVGANAAARLSDDSSVIAVIGTVNSTVAEKVAPILDGQKVVMVSPANTDPTLTRGTDPKKVARPHPYYFRVAANDLAQGPFAAEFAYRKAGRRNVAVIHDKSTYGQGVALQFKAAFERLGGRVPIVETIDPKDREFPTAVTKVRATRPDLIYFGGEYAAAAALTSQSETPLMGGYSIFDPLYVNTANAAEGDFATSVAATADQLPAAKPFLDAYTDAGYTDPYEAYGPYAYDAARLVISAVAKVLPGQGRITDEGRAEVRQAVQDTALDGVTGRITFDQYGDTTSRFLTVYKVIRESSGVLAWKPEETRQFP